MMAADWVADTQLQFSQLSYEDNALEDATEEASSSDSELSNQSFDAGPGSQRQPLEISSDESDQEPSDGEPSDGEPRRSGRVKKVTRTIQSQQE
jgi:hypothetical protein